VNGFLVDPGDVDALSKAIIRMAGATDEVARMSRESKRLLEPFLWRSIARRVISEYDRLLQERKRR
jgi:glycosyltransferase involved in cell wall biosynthesis